MEAPHNRIKKRKKKKQPTWCYLTFSVGRSLFHIYGRREKKKRTTTVLHCFICVQEMGLVHVWNLSDLLCAGRTWHTSDPDAYHASHQIQVESSRPQTIIWNER